MRRPSFRMALVLAALGGAAVVGTRARKDRSSALPSAPAPSTTWPPLADRTPTTAPADPGPVTAGSDDVAAPSPAVATDGPTEVVVAADAPAEVVTSAASTGRTTASPTGAGVVAAASPPGPEPDVTDVIRIPASGGDPVSASGADAAEDDEVRRTSTSSGTTWTFGGEGDTDSDRSAGSPLRADDPSLDPEPEAVIPAERIDRARSESSLIAHGDEGDVPPAPEPTFGTAPDPEAAATAPVHVATPIEVEPDEPLAIPHRPGHDDEGSAS